MSDNQTQAIILAAGRGSRMGKHTEVFPKCYVPFLERRLIDWQLSALRASGIEKICIVTGYASENFDEFQLKTVRNARWAETNMVYSLFEAYEVLKQAPRTIISYSDIIYHPDIIRTLLKVEDDVVVTVDTGWLDLWGERFEDPLSDAESLKLNENNEILDIGQKVSNLEDIMAQYMGLTSVTPDGADRLFSLWNDAEADAAWLCGRDKENCYMTDLLRAAISSSTPLKAALIEGGWAEFDSGEDIRCYEEMISQGKLPKLASFLEGSR